MIRVAFMSGNTIYYVSLDPGTQSAKLDLEWSLSDTGFRDFAGLTCVSSGIFLLHASRTDRAASPALVSSHLLRALPQMKSVDELQTAANLPLIWPTVSPDETRAAARTSIAGRPVPAVLDLRNGELRTFPEHWYIYPYSWTAAGNKILFERENRDRKTWEVGEIDPVTGKLRLLGEGAQPISSRQEGRVAFVSVDLKTISVREGGGATLTFRGFFKRLLAWLDETRILFVSGVGYVDSLGILDTKTSAIETYKLPSHGEISGGCELTSH